MKLSLFFLALLLSVSTLIYSQEKSINPDDKIMLLEGVWTIDLRPTADAEPYLKEFVIKLEPNKTFGGEFYGSPVENGLINGNWERVYFAFSTKDQSNEYFHSGYLLEGKIYGTTYCPNRDFIAPWEGSKN